MTRRLLRLRADSSAPALARKALADTGWVSGDRLGDAELLISELVTNAIRHGPPAAETIAVKLERSARHLRVEVRDSGTGFTAGTQVTSPYAGGLGLQLIQKLADRWGIAAEPTTRVWFEIQIS